MLIVLIPFVGHGYNMPNVGELIDPPEPIRAHLLSINVAAEYETKVMPAPDMTKKKQSGSSRPARVARKKTRKRSRKSAKK